MFGDLNEIGIISFTFDRDRKSWNFELYNVR